MRWEAGSYGARRVHYTKEYACNAFDWEFWPSHSG
jgi:hypothetical protein